MLFTFWSKGSFSDLLMACKMLRMDASSYSKHKLDFCNWIGSKKEWKDYHSLETISSSWDPLLHHYPPLPQQNRQKSARDLPLFKIQAYSKIYWCYGKKPQHSRLLHLLQITRRSSSSGVCKKPQLLHKLFVRFWFSHLWNSLIQWLCNKWTVYPLTKEENITDLKYMSSEQMSPPTTDAKMTDLHVGLHTGENKTTWPGYGFFRATAKLFLENKCL